MTRKQKAVVAQRLRKQKRPLREIAQALGCSISYAHALSGWDVNGDKKRDYAERYFTPCECGGWKSRVANRCQACECADPSDKYSDEELIGAIHDHLDNGVIPTTRDSPPSYNTYRRAFGSFAVALEAAGVEMRPSKRGQIFAVLSRAKKPLTAAEMLDRLGVLHEERQRWAYLVGSLVETGHVTCVGTLGTRGRPGLYVTSGKPLRAIAVPA